jgi:hypothetical protein
MPPGIDGLWNVYFDPLRLGRLNETSPAHRGRLRPTPSSPRATHVPGFFCYLSPRPFGLFAPFSGTNQCATNCR